MATCASCGAALAVDAAFCPSCGKPASAQPARPGGPDVERMRQAAVQAQGAVMSLGAEKITALVGGIVGAVGTLLPFYDIPSDSMMGEATGGASANMVGQGGVGLLVLAVAIVLGALPLLMKVSRMLSIAGLGLATLVIGILIGDRTFSFMGQSIPIDFGVGFYFALLGFLVLAYAYGRRANEA